MTKPNTTPIKDIDTQIESLLRSEFYVNSHDDCEATICSKRHYSDEAFERATQAIKTLLIQSKISSLEKLWDMAKDNTHMYWGDGSPSSLKQIIDNEIKALKEEL